MEQREGGGQKPGQTERGTERGLLQAVKSGGNELQGAEMKWGLLRGWRVPMGRN